MSVVELWMEIQLREKPLDMSVKHYFGKRLPGLTFVFITLLRGFIDNSAVLQTTQVKHTDTSVCTTRHEYIDTPCAEPYIVNLFIVSNELSLRGQSRNIPDCAGRVNA